MRYYARFRELPGTDSASIRALTTRYTYGTFKRPCTGPRGGKAYKEQFRSVYYHAGRFYRDRKVQTSPDEWEHVFAPYTGLIWDRFKAQSEEQGIPVCSIRLEDGYPVSIRMDGVDTVVHVEEWSLIEAVLGLDKKPRKSPAK